MLLAVSDPTQPTQSAGLRAAHLADRAKVGHPLAEFV
jgi:hypothetical protein